MKKTIIGILCCLLVLCGITAFEYNYVNTCNQNGFQDKKTDLCVGQSYKETLKKGSQEGTWTILDETIASVSQDGTVTGLAVGSTQLVVKDGIYKYKCKIVIREHHYIDPTCEQDGYCEYCGIQNSQKALGHDATELTCTQDSVCKRCGAVLQTATGHVFREADCTHAQECIKCGIEGDAALGHEFSAPTCEEGAKCVRCGIEGEEGPLGHDFAEATCELPEVCTRCGETRGEPLGHQISKIVCLKPVVCERCGKVLEEAADHDFKPATCTKPETCSRCKATKGKALGHDADPATCTSDSVCKRCKKVIQKKVPHEYVDTANGRICAYCGQAEPKAPTTTTGDSSSAQAYIDKVVALVNEQRAANGLSALTADPTLMKVAQLRSDECITAYSHTRPNGTDCFTAFSEGGASYRTAGENIAAGYKTPEAVMDGWMNSEGHRANILNPSFHKIGVGVSQCSSGVYHIYWAQAFTD